MTHAGAVQLYINIDHVATVRNARGTPYPDPVQAAEACLAAGANGITAHLREDRRHIRDGDIERLRGVVRNCFNLEMAATPEMVALAKRVKPEFATLVPERREELTTEGGLDVVKAKRALNDVVRELADAQVPVSMFIEADRAAIDASVECGARSVEFHTGAFAHAWVGDDRATCAREIERLHDAATYAGRIAPNMRVAAGHGLTADSLEHLVRHVPAIEEVNIGHAAVADALFVGFTAMVQRYLTAIQRGTAARS